MVSKIQYAIESICPFSNKFNPYYVIGFETSVEIARKSGCLEILAEHRYGEIENSNEVANFVCRAGSARNRLHISD